MMFYLLLFSNVNRNFLLCSTDLELFMTWIKLVSEKKRKGSKKGYSEQIKEVCDKKHKVKFHHPLVYNFFVTCFD